MATKVSVYSLSDLKSTLDDHIPLFLTSPNLPSTSTPLPKSLRFTQSHFHANVRLALGYAAVGLTLYIFYLDYYLKLPWLEHKVETFWSVLGYMLLNGAIMAWTWGWERGIVFEGARKGKSPTEIKFRSLPPHRKSDPTYRVVVEWRQGAAGRDRKKECTAPFTGFFQGDGTFVSGEFERWLKAQLPEVLSGPATAAEKVEVEVGDVIVVDSDNKTSVASTGTDAGGVTSPKKRSKTKG